MLITIIQVQHNLNCDILNCSYMYMFDLNQPYKWPIVAPAVAQTWTFQCVIPEVRKPPHPYQLVYDCLYPRLLPLSAIDTCIEKGVGTLKVVQKRISQPNLLDK